MSNVNFGADLCEQDLLLSVGEPREFFLAKPWHFVAELQVANTIGALNPRSSLGGPWDLVTPDNWAPSSTC